VASTPTISGRAIQKLLDALPDLGLDPRALASGAALDPTAWPAADARVPLERLHALWERVLEKIPRPDLALIVAQRYSPGDYALLGFVCMQSADLGEGMRQVARYVRLWTDEPALAGTSDPGIELTYRHPFPDGPGVRLATEAVFAELLHGARLLTQSAISPVDVTFRHNGPEDTRAHEEFFGAPVRFGQPRALLRFSPGDVHRPIPRADPQLGAYLQQLATDALAKREDPESLIGRLRGLVAEELRGGVPDLRRMAARMAMSERTLRRRLRDAGASWRHLLDETRANLARSYVSDRRLALSEVAFLLGFSEPSTFHRAFKRWVGETPGAFRERR
jgi:AraC-like DNA-binding protein